MSIPTTSRQGREVYLVANQYRTMHRQPNPILRQFFSDLIRAADKTDKPDVRAFIKTWREGRLQWRP